MEILEVLNQFRIVGKYCDATLSIGEKDILVHQNILAACSPVIDKELAGVSGHVRVFLDNTEGWDEEIVRQLVEFLYSGEINIHQQNLEQLCNLAVSLTILQLQRKIKDAMICRLKTDVSFFLEAFSIALKFKALDLIEDLIPCFCEYVDFIFSQEAFRSMSVQILSDLLENFGQYIGPLRIIHLLFQWITLNTIKRLPYLSDIMKRYVILKELTENFFHSIKQMEQNFSLTDSIMLTFLQTLHDMGIPLGPLTEDLDRLQASVSPDLIPVSEDLCENKASCVRYITVCVCVVSHDDFTESMQEVSGSTSTTHVKVEVNETNIQAGNHSPFSENSTQGTSPSSNIQNLIEFSAPEYDNKAALYLQGVEEVSTDPCTELGKGTGFQTSDHVMSKNNNTRLRKRKSPQATKSRSQDLNRGIGKRKRSQALKVQPRGLFSGPRKRTKSQTSEVQSMDTIAEPGKAAQSWRICEEEERSNNEDGPAADIKGPGEDISKNNIVKSSRLQTATTESDTKVQRKSQKNLQHAGYPLQCHLCTVQTNSPGEYTRHLRVHFDGPAPYRCPDCDAVKPGLKDLRIHLYKHSKEQKFSCHCGLRFKYPSGLTTHMKIHKQKRERSFLCEICSKKFFDRATLETHKQRHSDVKPFLCDFCGYSSKTKSDLNTHKRSHTGKVFRCDFPNCEFYTPRICTIKRHKNTHSDIRNYQCHTCGKAFRNKGTLTIHERSHMDLKPYQCSECWYSTYRKDHYDKHMKKRHGDHPTAVRKMPVPRKRRDELMSQGWILPTGKARVKDRKNTSDNSLQDCSINFDPEEQGVSGGLKSYIQFLQ